MEDLVPKADRMGMDSERLAKSVEDNGHFQSEKPEAQDDNVSSRLFRSTEKKVIDSHLT